MKPFVKNKKIYLLVFTLLIASLLVLTGCHEKYDLEQLAKEYEESNPTPKPEDSSTSESDNQEETESSVESESSGGSGSSESSSTQAETSGTDANETPGTPPSAILGNRTSSSYSNSFFGIKFTAPNKDWYIADSSELAKIMEMAQSTVTDEDVLNQLQSSGYVMDLYTLDTSVDANSSSFDDINITIEDIGKMYGVLMSEQELADSTSGTIKKALESQGRKNVDVDVEEEVFAGSPRVCISVSSEKDGTTLYQKQIYIKKESYLACITVSSYGQDKTDTLLNSFSAL